MYELNIQKSFSAAHVLKEKDGVFENLHGHNFVVDLSVFPAETAMENHPLDFETLRKWLNETMQTLHHKNLNDLSFFKDCASSSENIAQYIFDEMAKKAASLNINISHVTVWESDDTGVTYKR
jgi:6-pyruvoyltetrahydropterin/6-carboxytetrahydropterin synthase